VYGLTRRQWALFAVAGFGYFADSVWPLLSGLVLSPAVNEFGFSAPFLSLALNIGLLFGAITWSVGSDIWGRRQGSTFLPTFSHTYITLSVSFNATLFITGAFGISAGAAPSFVGLACLFALAGFGVGGNMPVDSAVFLEFIPGSHQYLLTFLAIWWCIGQLIASLVSVFGSVEHSTC
jgi:MFS family permease